MPRRRIRPYRKKTLPRLKRWFSQRTLRQGILLLVFGALLIAFPKAYKYVSDHPAGLNPSQKATTKVTSVKNSTSPIQIDPSLLSDRESAQPPQRIVIPNLSIDLSIVEANVVDGYWELSETTASHGVGSANPGENGNIVVFAHAREGLFLPLRNIKAGDTIYILTKDRWSRYQVFETKEVAPAESQVIAPTPVETLTLYTCSGFLDSKRLIVSAKPLRT